jgi:proliferating cell nuclear antigen PCNA
MTTLSHNVITMSTLRLTFEDGGVLRNVISILKDVLESYAIECHPSGMRSSSMDKNHLMLITTEYDPAVFSSYICPRPTIMAFDLPAFSKLMDRGVKNGYHLTMVGTCPEPDSVEIVVTHPLGQTFGEYSMSTMIIEEQGMKIPEIDYTSIFRMTTKAFRELIMTIQSLGKGGSETVKITVWENCVAFKATNDIIKNAIFNLHPPPVTSSSSSSAAAPEKRKKAKLDVEPTDYVTILKCEGEESIHLPLLQLVSIARAHTFSENVEISIHPEQPIRFLFEEPGIGKMTYHLAPKFMNEEE